MREIRAVQTPVSPVSMVTEIVLYTPKLCISVISLKLLLRENTCLVICPVDYLMLILSTYSFMLMTSLLFIPPDGKRNGKGTGV